MGGGEKRGYKSEKRENTNRPIDISTLGFKGRTWINRWVSKEDQSLGCRVKWSSKEAEGSGGGSGGGGGGGVWAAHG